MGQIILGIGAALGIAGYIVVSLVFYPPDARRVGLFLVMILKCSPDTDTSPLGHPLRTAGLVDCSEGP